MNENSTVEISGNVEIDIFRLLAVYLEKWWLIALCAVLAASCSFLYTSTMITPLYRTGVTIYVNNNSRTNERLDYVSGTDLAASQQLVATYTNMLTSDTVLERVIETTGQNIAPGALRGCVSTQQVDETEIFKVYVSHPDPVVATQLANAIAQTAPDVIEDFVEGSSTKIIDYAKVPTGPYTPSYSRNIMLGGIIGAMIALLYLTLQVMLDFRIKDENDLMALFDLPILGQIPDMQQNPGRRGYSQKYYGYNTDKSGKKKKEDGEKAEGKEEPKKEEPQEQQSEEAKEEQKTEEVTDR